MIKPKSLHSTLHFVQYTYWHLFPLLKTVFELVDFYAFLCFCHFCFTSPTLVKRFPLRSFSSWETTTKKKLLWARLGQPGGWGRGVMPFLVKNCWTLRVVWAGILINHPSSNGQTHWKNFSKNSMKPNSLSQQHQLVHRYGWDPRTLT